MFKIFLARRKKGFTLVELIIVIVLLGILAITAIPKFADITVQARTSAAQGVAGAMASAASITHAQWLALGSPATVVIEGTTIVMSAEGFPEATTGTANGTATAAKCLEVWNGVMTTPPPASATTCTGDCEFLVQVTASPVCQYVDEQGNGSNTIEYNITTGEVTVQ